MRYVINISLFTGLFVFVFSHKTKNSKNLGCHFVNTEFVVTVQLAVSGMHHLVSEPPGHEFETPDFQFIR